MTNTNQKYPYDPNLIDPNDRYIFFFDQIHFIGVDFKGINTLVRK